MMYTEFQPAMTHQFVFFVEGIPTYLIRNASRPNVSFNTLSLPHINVNRRLKGKVDDYDDISLTLYDPIAPSGAQIVGDWLRLHHEATTGRDGYADLYKKDVTYQGLDPTGAFIQKWTLKGAFISSVDYSDADWGSDEEHTIDLSLTYDYPILEY